MKTNPGQRGRGSRPAAAPAPAAAAGALLSMAEAIALLKTTRPTFYRWLRSGKIRAMKVGRQWRFTREDLDRFLKGQAPRIELPVDPAPLVGALRAQLKKLGVENGLPPTDDKLTDAIDLMIVLADKMKASDIHLGPRDLDTADLRFRIDGTLHPIAEFDPRLLPALAAHWKSRAGCNPRETVRPQDGRVHWTTLGPDRRLDLRACFVPTATGESLTVRLLDPRALIITLERMPFNERDRATIVRWLQAPSGLIIVTGPTGCGKTTTLYAGINHLKTPAMKVITIEDPVEYILTGTTQLRVNAEAGVTFPVLLRSVLRSDPDVIMIGEVRDRETSLLAQAAALTGHLVLTTLHTSEAASGLQRLVDVTDTPFLVADSTKLVIAQRLVRCLCPKCSVARPPPEPALQSARDIARQGGVGWDALPKKFREPAGCAACRFTGFRGRTLVAEVLEVTPAIHAALLRRVPVPELRAIAVREGMSTLAAGGIRLAGEGKTSLSEVLHFLAPIYQEEATV